MSLAENAPRWNNSATISCEQAIRRTLSGTLTRSRNRTYRRNKACISAMRRSAAIVDRWGSAAVVNEDAPMPNTKDVILLP